MKFILEYTVVEEDSEIYIRNIMKYSKMYTRNKYIGMIFMFFFGIIVSNIFHENLTVLQSIAWGLFFTFALFIIFQTRMPYNNEKNKIEKQKELLFGERVCIISDKGLTIGEINTSKGIEQIKRYQKTHEKKPQILWSDVLYYTIDNKYMFFYLPNYKVVLIKSEDQLRDLENFLQKQKVSKKK